MIRFGLRLTVAAGREAATRLVIIAAAVALGVGLLLTTLAAVNGVNSQNARYAWLNSAALDTASPSAHDPLWWLLRGDYFHGQTMGRVEVAATGPDSPVPPGIPRLPGPGEYYASPALSRLLATTPAAELGDRFPGHQVGIIGDSALPSPDSLVVVIGHSPAELAANPDARQIDHVQATTPSDCGNCQIGIRAAGLDLILSVVAAGLLFPVLIFIGTATRLSATRREQRFAAMRLVGATPRQVSVIAAAEATVSAVAGTAVGFGLFYALRHLLAGIPFTGAPFFPDDLSLGPVAILGVALGVPLAAAAAARLALRRVHISPLGVTRRVTPQPPRASRLIPLVLGLGELGYFVGRRPHTVIGQTYAFLAGFLVVLVGLVVAGPWLTMVGSRVMASRATRPATLIAARRLADNPRAGFRSVSGLVLALFVTSVAIGVMGTITDYRGTSTSVAATANLVQFFPKPLAPTTTPVPAGLASVPGVKGTVVVHRTPDDLLLPFRDTPGIHPDGLALCTDIASAPSFGHCAPGATVAWVYADLLGQNDAAPDDPLWPAAAVTPEQLQGMPVDTIVVGTDGSSAAIEKARTVLEAAYPRRDSPSTEAEWRADTTRVFNQWKQLANVVIVASLAIAGCSLAVSVAGGISERKRPFSMLRLTGVQLRVLRRVVALESGVPLLSAAVVAIGTGFVASDLFLRAQMQYTLHSPGFGYYALVLAGLVASLGIIASTLPLLRRITGPETARNE